MMDTLLKIADHVPWSLLFVVLAAPYLKRQAKKIKSADLRASYMDIVRFVEMTCGGTASVVKKATAVEKIAEQGLPLNQVLLEAVVHEVTGSAKKASAAVSSAAAQAGAA
ncbi:MAG: hypothetical protein ACYC63_16875 [Armatimonadota bacterium]